MPDATPKPGHGIDVTCTVTLAASRTDTVISSYVAGGEYSSLLGYDEKTRKFAPARMTKPGEQRRLAVYEITTMNGYRLAAAPGTLVGTPNGWKEIQQLKPREDKVWVRVDKRMVKRLVLALKPLGECPTRHLVPVREMPVILVGGIAVKPIP
jgi:hypothetical protein